MTVDVGTVDFKALEAKAKAIAERRSFLQAQESSLAKQIEDIEGSLVSEYGSGYMSVFNDAVAKIGAWETAHAAV